MHKTNIYWGDIHNHNEIGYGKGKMTRSFDLAENTLDFYAFTPHGWWPDLPDDDEPVKKHHQEGFEKVSSNWDKIRQMVLDRYNEGKFVTFIGWEWHSLEWGDYCIYFSNPEQEMYNAESLDGLKKYCISKGAIIIPHHPGYKNGWRGLNWDCLDESVTPVVEIFSEHGNSFEAKSHMGMYNHSMGGVELSQSGLEQLKKGRKFGFIACSDDHYGYPGGYGFGLTAVYADKLDRDSIFSAIKNRNTYAVTGDRIKLFFTVNDALPGDTIPASGVVRLDFNVQTRDKIKLVEIFKNSLPLKIYTAIDYLNSSRINQTEELNHMAKIEWGWDFIASGKVTKWDIVIETKNSTFHDVVPAFCGGAGSVTEMNILECTGNQHIRVNSFTSRKNSFPVNSISFLWEGESDSNINLIIEAVQDGQIFKKKLDISKTDLIENDEYLSIINRFSSPKLKVHTLLEPKDYEFSHSVKDTTVKHGDYYFIKVTQENGQMAWSSPVWITD